MQKPPSSENDPLALLAEAVSGEEARIDLGFAALAVAAGHYPDLAIDDYLGRLDRMAAQARAALGRARDPARALPALQTLLFEELGFRGNREDYYDPANSFLNEVLERRTGLPITLSIVTIAIAERLGLPVFGVGLPLHFVVKFQARARAIFIDPFYGGEILTSEGCRARVEQIAGRPIALDPALLEALPKRRILYRLLNNLKQIYLHREEPGLAGRVVEQMLIVAPDSYADMRDRGLLLLQENALTAGAAWLSRYLEKVPQAPDADQVRSAIDHAFDRRARLN